MAQNIEERFNNLQCVQEIISFRYSILKRTRDFIDEYFVVLLVSLFWLLYCDFQLDKSDGLPSYEWWSRQIFHPIPWPNLEMASNPSFQILGYIQIIGHPLKSTNYIQSGNC